MRNLAVLAMVGALSMSAAPPKPRAALVAPDTLPHSMALFLGGLSEEGGRQVTFKARAHGIRFFFEEPTGVTVYRFERGKYVKEEFLRDFTLERAVKRHAPK